MLLGCACLSGRRRTYPSLYGQIAEFNWIGKGTQLWWLSSSDKNVVIDEQIAQQYQISIVHHNVPDGMVSSSLYINATVDVLLIVFVMQEYTSM